VADRREIERLIADWTNGKIDRQRFQSAWTDPDVDEHDRSMLIMFTLGTILDEVGKINKSVGDFVSEQRREMAGMKKRLQLHTIILSLIVFVIGALTGYLLSGSEAISILSGVVMTGIFAIAEAGIGRAE
jgi:hypothetical protein